MPSWQYKRRLQMHDLIKITDKEGVQLVKAKELYEFLGLHVAAWKRWYQKNIIGNSFAVKDVDYFELNMMSSSNNGSWTKDFDLTLDFAKKLSMLAKSAKGEEIRQYFIDVEKKYQAIPMKSALDDDDILAKGILIAQRRISDQSALIQRQANYIKEVQPKIEYTEKVLTSQTCWTSTTIAKDMGLKSAQQLHKKLNAMGIIFKDSDGIWVPYSKYADKNLTETRTSTYTDSHGKLLSTSCILINSETSITGSDTVILISSGGMPFRVEMIFLPLHTSQITEELIELKGLTLPEPLQIGHF